MRSWPAYSRCASTYALQTFIAPVSSMPTRRARISCRPAAVSKNHCPSCLTSGIGNGQPSAPISRVTLESELVTNRVFSARRWTNILYSSVAWTTSGEIKACPSGPKILWRAFVSWFWAAATRALTASCGAVKDCSSAADAHTGNVSASSAKPGPDARGKIRRNHEKRLGFISGNVCVEIIWMKGLTPRLGIETVATAAAAAAGGCRRP